MVYFQWLDNSVEIMATRWIFELEDAVIEKIRSYPALWKPTHPSHNKKLLKKHLYGEIAMELAEEYPDIEGIDADAIMNKFHVLKNSFKRELARMKRMKSDASKWKHFVALSFLIDVVTPGENTPNPSTASSDEEMSSDTTGESTPKPCRPSSTSFDIPETAEVSVQVAPSFKAPIQISRIEKKRHLEASKQIIIEKPEKYLDVEDRNKKKRHLESPKQNIIRKLEKFLDAEDEIDIFGKLVAKKLRKLNDLQQLYAEKEIMNVLYNCSVNSIPSSSQVPLANVNPTISGETFRPTNSPCSVKEEDFSYIPL